MLTLNCIFRRQMAEGGEQSGTKLMFSIIVPNHARHMYYTSIIYYYSRLDVHLIDQ